jgi:hypothetical protein
VVKITSVRSSQPRRSTVASTRPQASSISSFMTWTLALISRIWSWVSRPGTKSAGPPSRLENDPSQYASQCGGLPSSTLRIASSDPGWPSGRSRSRQSTRSTSESGGSHGWWGSGKLIQQNQSSPSARPSSHSTVTSATQSVVYQDRGMGFSLVSGAPVSPPGSAWRRSA